MANSVVVLGKGSLAIRVAEWFKREPSYELVAVVPVVPEPTWTESLLDWAHENEVEFVPSGRYEDLERVPDDGFDLGFSVFYDRIIRASFIERCARILNLHNSPLPRYRGVSPINWALANGEPMHGVTIHEITPEIDAGPIVAQALYSIYPEIDEVQDVYARALEYGWTLFEQTMPLLHRIAATPQNDADATYYATADNDRLGERRGFTRQGSER